MYILLSIISIFSFLLFFWGLVWLTPKSYLRILPSHLFVFFMALTWSPLCFFPLEQTHIFGVELTEDGKLVFSVTYATMFMMIFFGFLLSSIFVNGNKKALIGNVRHLTPVELRKFSIVIIIISFALIFVYLVSTELRGQIQALWSYAVAENILSYTDLRRNVVVHGFLMESVYGRAQYSLVAFVFVALLLLSANALSKGRKDIAIAYLLIAVALFIVCAASFKKRPYLYYFSLAMAVFFLYNRISVMDNKKLLFKSSIGIILSISLMLLLYSIQYRDNLFNDLSDNLSILYFRVFSAYPAGYKLYVDLYPQMIPHTYGKDIGLLQPILGSAEQPYLAVPGYYQVYNTTFPSGFVSYAYASFGYIGVVFFSLFVGLIIGLLNIFVLSRKTREFQIISMIVLGFSTLFFASRPFFSTLLGAGIGWIPIMIVMLERYTMSSKYDYTKP